MKRALTALALVAVAGLAVAAPVGAGGEGPQFDYSPASGPPGTTITASGNCLTDFEAVEASGAEAYGFAGATANLELIDENSNTVDTASQEIAEDGSWGLEVMVPGDADAPQDMTLSAYCEFHEEDGAQPLGRAFTGLYADQIFSVTQPPDTTVPAADVQPAGTTAATPLQTQPSFTG